MTQFPSRRTMMLSFLAAGAAGAALLAAPLGARIQNDGAAPGFTLTDMNGKRVSLSQFRGRTVVLEWHNPGCPFVRKHYDSGNMQATQTAAARQGAVWLVINSGAKGKQGDLTAAEAQAMAKREKFAAAHYLFDRAGTVGKAYGARTTPHMYVIDGKGRIAYQGGIDDKPTANAADIKGARNHVSSALSELKAGKAVSVASSRPYGCSVKYADA